MGGGGRAGILLGGSEDQMLASSGLASGLETKQELRPGAAGAQLG